MNFNWQIYRELNPDLERVGLKTQSDFVNHYMIHGKDEKRKYNINQLYPDFNRIQYRQNYEDLRQLNPIQLDLHWIKNGTKEGRTYKPLKNTVIKNNKFNLINGIDIIYWINLDRSKDRRVLMEKILKNIKIQNKRIPASDGTLIPNIQSNFVTITPKNQSTGVYGCLLSHLRTIQEFWGSTNNIALVLEDDISLDFMPFWNKDMKTIIGQAPLNWDIIMLHYTDTNPYNHQYLYNRWNSTICSTMAYIINKRGAQKIIRLYKDGKWSIPVKDHVADVVIYNGCNTYVYRYPYFTINSSMNSLLHNDHLETHNKSKLFTKNLWMTQSHQY